MLEKKYDYTVEQSKIIERIVDDGNVNLNHIILPKGDSLPEHFTNSKVYFIIVRGTMTLKLADQDVQKYRIPNLIVVPFNTKMNIRNDDDEILEFFVFKSPHPDVFK